MRSAAPGRLKGQTVGPEILLPLPADELDAWEGDDADTAQSCQVTERRDDPLATSPVTTSIRVDLRQAASGGP